MKKLLSLIITLLLLLSLCSAAFAEGEDAGGAPSIKKPVHVTIVDELGAPVSGASLEVLNPEKQVVESWTAYGSTSTVFLPAGEYNIQYSAVPEGYIADTDETGFTVTVQEAELRDDLVGQCFFDHSHSDVCNNSNHIGIETYAVLDGESSVTAYCFNQNYDNPTPASRYKRLVGSPELLYTLAQNKNGSLSPQGLYDHVLATIYHSASVQAEYGLDDIEARYITNMALKSFTDPACFVSFDDEGNSTLKRDENGKPVRDENGNYVYLPGGTVLGSLINHARVDNGEDVFPQKLRDAYHALISFTDHPSDYYLYIYYPENFQAGNTDTFQCLMSVFQVEPVRVTLSVKATVQIDVTKVWDDADNQDGFRPSAEEFRAAIHLLANGEDVTESYQDKLVVEDNGDNTYTVRFTDLPKLNAEKEEIQYQIQEDPIPRYTCEQPTASSGEIITNKHQPETTQIDVTKTWDDGDDADGLRPTEVIIRLLADGEELQSVQLTVEGNWSYSFRDLPVYKTGKAIVYTVTEDPVENYETKVEGYTVTNTHQPETTEIGISKAWDDNDNQDGLRPESIKVNLLADGKVIQTVTVTPDKDGNWSYTFQDLQKNSKGKEIVYTITEETVKGYESTVDGFKIVNKHTPAVINLPVVKNWLDSNDKAGKRPASITIHLYADGTMVQTVTLRADSSGNWGYTFQDLPKYSNGHEIKYTVTEDSVTGYYTSITPYNSGYLIRNSTTPLTGDTSSPALWAGLLAVSLLGLSGMAYLLFLNRKRKQIR